MGQSFSGALTYRTLKPRAAGALKQKDSCWEGGQESDNRGRLGAEGLNVPSRIPTLFTSFLIMGSTELNAEPGRFSNLPFSISIVVW